MQRLGQNQFRQIIRDGIREECSQHGWREDRDPQRGWAFQYWCARQILAAERYDTDIEEAVFLRNDLKADIVLEDSTSKQLLICQCKFAGQNAVLDEDELASFFDHHTYYKDRHWVANHGSADVRAALIDYGEKLQEGWSIELRFITPARTSDRCDELPGIKQEEIYQRGDGNVTFSLYDATRFKDYYVASLSVDESIPPIVEIDLPSGRFFTKERPHRTLIASIKGNTLRNLFRQHKESIYAWNIRGYLGNRGLNAEIARTASSDPSDFFYFNNGVSAICISFALSDNHLTANKMQIINGAQTVSSLWQAGEDSDVEVLFRLTVTQSVSTEKGFNQRIIQANNSQNQVKLSDFRSNDEIQVFLEQQFKRHRAKGPVPKIRYLRKRQVGRRGGEGRALKLEDLGKIRYAYLYEPTRIHDDPKSLWIKSPDGVYEKAFGVEGQLEAAWSEAEFTDALLAVSLYIRIEDEAKQMKSDDSETAYMYRLRYHLLSLAGEAARNVLSSSERKSLTSNKARFDEFFYETIWPVASDTAIGIYEPLSE